MSFRILAVVLFILLASTGIYHRLKAEKSEELISRSEEGMPMLIGLRLGGLAAWLTLMLYLVYPQALQWATLEFPLWLKCVGASLAILSVPLFHWMLRSLGTNITDTVITRKQATLVMHGPYRWVRHPMYLITLLLFAGFTLMTANWFLGLTGVFTVGLLMIRSRKEEENLVKRFGQKYLDYIRTTGKFFPRLK